MQNHGMAHKANFTNDCTRGVLSKWLLTCGLWPLWSPGLNPCTYYLWVVLKEEFIWTHPIICKNWKKKKPYSTINSKFQNQNPFIWWEIFSKGEQPTKQQVVSTLYFFSSIICNKSYYWSSHIISCMTMESSNITKQCDVSSNLKTDSFILVLLCSNYVLLCLMSILNNATGLQLHAHQVLTPSV
jgi:hypothetical protein